MQYLSLEVHPPLKYSAVVRFGRRRSAGRAKPTELNYILLGKRTPSA